jgi:hypothetical protein
LVVCVKKNLAVLGSKGNRGKEKMLRSVSVQKSAVVTSSHFRSRTVAEAVLDLVLLSDGLGPERLTLLLNFLHHTRFTVVFEILQPHYQVGTTTRCRFFRACRTFNFIKFLFFF